MKLTEIIMRKRFAPGPGVTELPPDKGIRQFFFLLSTHFGKLFRLNLLLVLFSIPIITMPAALCGMNRVLVLLVREGHCFLWSDFIKEFKESFLKSIPFGLLFVVLSYISGYSYSIYIYNADINSFMLLFAVVAIWLSFTAALFSSYIFVLIPMLPLRSRDIAKNAFALMTSEWKTDLVILVSTAVSFILIGTAAATIAISAANAVLVLDLSIIVVLLLVLIYFSFSQLAVCVAVNQAAQKRIIGPYEQSIETRKGVAG